MPLPVLSEPTGSCKATEGVSSGKSTALDVDDDEEEWTDEDALLIAEAEAEAEAEAAAEAAAEAEAEAARLAEWQRYYAWQAWEQSQAATAAEVPVQQQQQVQQQQVQQQQVQQQQVQQQQVQQQQVQQQQVQQQQQQWAHWNQDGPYGSLPSCQPSSQSDQAAQAPFGLGGAIPGMRAAAAVSGEYENDLSNLILAWYHCGFFTARFQDRYKDV